jgi:hypothetical protein
MQTLIIPGAFVFLAAILLWITIGLQGKWWVKLLAMVVTLLVSLEIWRSLDSYVGYFKAADLGSMTDQRATLFWARVDEPDGNLSDPGAIYMWMRLEGKDDQKWWFANPSVGKMPQVFRFSYSREFHKAIASAVGKILEDNGNPIEIAFNQLDQQQRKIGLAGATRNQAGDSSKLPEDETGSMSLGPGIFYVLPPSKLPPKLSAQTSDSFER